MAEVVSPFALTTLQRVKDLIFDPGLYIKLTGCTVTQNSTDVTGVTVPTGEVILVGQPITGTGIPSGTTIAAIISATEITLSQAATATNTGQTLTVTDQPTSYDTLLTRLINASTNYLNNACGRFSFVQQTYSNDTYSIDNPRQSFLYLRNTPVFPASDGIHLTSFQWRAGTPSNPNWTDFIADQYELVNPRTDPISGKTWYPSGIVRVYGVLPRIYNNMIRASYTGGYPVNWSNPEDHNTHWLPADLSYASEKMVERWYTRRTDGGKKSVALEGATVTWDREVDQDVKDVIGQYAYVNWE